MAIDIENRKEQGGSYFCALDDGMQVGVCDYYEMPGRMVITHVGVDPQYRGGGVAKSLVMAAVDHARSSDIKITPVCSYARAVFARTPELDDILYKE